MSTFNTCVMFKNMLSSQFILSTRIFLKCIINHNTSVFCV